MTSDMGEMFNEMRAASKEKRASNREASAQILRSHGIDFETKNIDAHLIVHHGTFCVDFWPGTGKWKDRKGKYGRGVFQLLKYLGVKAPQ